MANKKVKFELTAVDKTKAAFDKVTKGLKGIGGAAAGVTKGVAGIGIAAGATATALAFMVDKSFQAVDAIGKTATQTGIATDTLQAFHLAARESGTTIEGANTALIKFARSIGDAERGLKTQADIFKNIGVELRTTDGRMRSFDSILEDTAKGIMELGSQSEKASALANLFGRQGVILTGAITDLSENGIKKFIDRAKELGIVLSEKVIRRTEEFNDAVGVIKMQIGSFVNNITTSFLPLFEEMQKRIAKFIQDAVDEAGGMDALGVKIANSIINGLAKAIESLGTFSDFLAKTFTNIGAEVLKLGNHLLELQQDFMSLMPRKFADELGQLELMILHNDVAIQDLSNNTTDFAERAKDISDKLKTYKLNVDDLRGSNEKLDNGLDSLNKSFTNIASPLQVFIDSLGKEGLAKTIEQTTVGSLKKFEDSIVDSLKAGKLEFKNFADYVVEQLLRIAIQQMILKPITGKFESFFEGFGDLFSADGGGYTGMGARAGGVDGKGGFPAILHPNETVIDHTKGQAVGGATVNFNISTVDAAGFDQLLASRKGLITSIINNAMNNQGKMGIV